MNRVATAVTSALLLSLSQAPAVASELVDASVTRVAGASTVDAVAAKALFDQEAAFVDLRKDNAWEAGRIPGAIHLDFRNAFSREALEAKVDRDEPVVFYCSGVHCPRSSKAAGKALEWGYQRVYYFREGFPGWQNAGYPIE
jgi:rhodanese-related sulfurtransferase